MNTQWFQAHSMNEVITAIRQTFGEDAVILETRRQRLPFGRERIHVLAASGADAMLDRTQAEPQSAERRAERVRATLRDAGMEQADAEKLLLSALGELPMERIRQALIDRIPVNPVFPSRPGGWVALIGPAGAGKTTALMKLAIEYGHKRRKRLLITTCDQRIGASESLVQVAQALGLPVMPLETGEDIAKAREIAAGCDLVLCDTPGLSPGRDERWREVRQILDSAQVADRFLVLPVTGSTAYLQGVIEGFRTMSPSHLVVSRLDESPVWGLLPQLAESAHLPLAFTNESGELTSGLSVANAEILAVRILGERVLKPTGRQPQTDPSGHPTAAVLAAG